MNRASTCIHQTSGVTLFERKDGFVMDFGAAGGAGQAGYLFAVGFGRDANAASSAEGGFAPRPRRVRATIPKELGPLPTVSSNRRGNVAYEAAPSSTAASSPSYLVA